MLRSLSCNGDARKKQWNSPAFIVPLLSQAESDELIRVGGTLGEDPSSNFFANRTKNIAFVICLNGRWFHVNQNNYNQAQEYNDFSGGYKRFYRQLPSSFIESEVTQSLLNCFQKLHNIPEGQLVLVQIQSSNITKEEEGKCITGQGIHTDGADCGMLVCLHRKNICGARSSAYYDVHGTKPVITPTVLEDGDAMFWKDNKIYHYVDPATLTRGTEKGIRTVLVALYPAMYLVTGESNVNNTLPSSGYHPPDITVVPKKFIWWRTCWDCLTLIDARG